MGQSSNDPYRGQYHTPWSPNAFSSASQYGGRAGDFGMRGQQYDGMTGFNDNRGSFPYIPHLLVFHFWPLYVFIEA